VAKSTVKEDKVMAKFKDTCDLYDDNGKLLKSGVALEKISPLNNAGIL